MNFEYQTIKSISEGVYKEKGSKFFAYSHPVQSEDEVKELVKQYKKEYYDARHHCYAYILGAEKDRFRAADDGEPANSAGNPILGQIRSKELTNVMVMVVRYFGGTKLGVPGLINAYRSAAEDALNNAKIIIEEVFVPLNISFTYDKMDTIMKIIKTYDLKIKANSFENNSCIYNIEYRIKDESQVLDKLQIYSVD